jgi:RimJ/RimL family protein N-acetyltransferase
MNLTFRKLAIEDMKYHVKWLNDPEICRFLGPNLRQGKISEEELIAKFEKGVHNKEREFFTILLDEVPVGFTALTNINLVDKNASVFLLIGERNLQGQGIGKKSLKFITDYGFDDLGLHKIWLECFTDNKIAINCYKSFGFVEEGYFKEQAVSAPEKSQGSSGHEGKFCDEVRMAIIRKNTSI